MGKENFPKSGLQRTDGHEMQGGGGWKGPEAIILLLGKKEDLFLDDFLERGSLLGTPDQDRKQTNLVIRWARHKVISL